MNTFPCGTARIVHIGDVELRELWNLLSHRMELSQWDLLDTIILTQIFEYLPISDRFSASLVCRRWYGSFKSAKVWHRLNVTDCSFCNEHGTLDYDRAKAYIIRFGYHIQTITVDIRHNFNGLYQFLVLLRWFIDPKLNDCQTNVRPLSRLRKISLALPRSHTFEYDNPGGLKLFGIGGLIVSALMQLLLHLNNLTELAVLNMSVERFEANRLLDCISVALSAKLKRLTLVNLTESHCSLTQIGMFSNLQILRISPQQIDNSMIRSIGSWSQLRHLVIVQDDHTPTTALACSASAWSTFSPAIRVHLHTSERNRDLMLHPMAPFHSITRHGIKARLTSQIIRSYRRTLTVYVTASSTIREPCDADVLHMTRECDLDVLVICEPVTTHALLSITQLSRPLRRLYVKKSMVIEQVLETDDLHGTCHPHQLPGNGVPFIADSLTATIQAIRAHLPQAYFLDDAQFERIQLSDACGWTH